MQSKDLQIWWFLCGQDYNRRNERDDGKFLGSGRLQSSVHFYKMLLLLAILRTAYRPHEDDFHFYAGCKKVNNRKICEAAFLNLIGLMNSPNVSDAPNQWQRLKEHVSCGKDGEGIEYGADKLKSKMKGETRVKFNHAVAFIEYFAKTFGDTIPDEHGM